MCDFSSTTGSYLNKHKKAVHLGIKYPCDQCDFKTAKESALNYHKYSVHGDKSVRHQCHLCPRSFLIACWLKDHIKFAHEGFRFHCQLCDFSGSRKALLRHKRSIHEQRYKCEHCDYNGSTLKYLQEHTESKHLGIRYNCDQCVASFGSTRNLNQHIKLIHGEPQSETKVSSTDYSCRRYRRHMDIGILLGQCPTFLLHHPSPRTKYSGK